MDFLEQLNQIDHQLFLWINQKGFSALDPVFQILSHKLVWIPLYVWSLYLVYKKLGRQIVLFLVFVIMLITAADRISSGYLKPEVARWRPCHEPLFQEKVRVVQGCGGDYGFVSSHAANSFAIAVFLSLFWKKRKTTLFWLVWAIFVSISRVYLGVHFPGDILVGALLGSALGLALYPLYFYLQHKIYRSSSFIS